MGLYLYHDHGTTPVVRPGDALPGGGSLKSVNDYVHTYDLNNPGDISFSAVLDNGDQGVYVKPHDGPIQVVARTGTVIPGIGTFSADGGNGFLCGPLVNDLGQLLFAAILASGDTVLVLATPNP